MYPWRIRRGVPLQAANEEFIAEWPRDPGKKRNTQRLNAVDLKGVDVLCVVAPEKAAAFSGPQPLVALPNRKHVVQQNVGEVCLHNPKIIGRGNRPCRNCGLAGIVRERDQIDVRQQGAEFVRIAGRGGSMLIFSPKGEGKPSVLAACAEAGYVVEAFCIRPAVVVDDGLAKMKAIAQWRTGYTGQPGIDTLKLRMRLARPIEQLNVRFQFPLQGMIDLAGFSIVVNTGDLVGGLNEHIHDTQSSPWAHSEIGRIDITKGLQAGDSRVDPNCPQERRLSPREQDIGYR